MFRGWARMAVPIDTFTIVEVRKPNVGETKPAGVEADVIINTAGVLTALWADIPHAAIIPDLMCDQEKIHLKK